MRYETRDYITADSNGDRWGVWDHYLAMFVLLETGGHYFTSELDADNAAEYMNGEAPMTSITKQGGYLRNVRNTSKIADIASKAWDAGMVEEINGIDVQEYVQRMAAHAIKTLFWADTTAYEVGHDDDLEGQANGDYDLPYYNAEGHDGDDLDPSDREEITADCEGFVRSAWPYLVAAASEPDDVGHDFHLTRNHHGAGFWDGDYTYGDSLTELSHPYGSVGVNIAVDADGDAQSFTVTH